MDDEYFQLLYSVALSHGQACREKLLNRSRFFAFFRNCGLLEDPSGALGAGGSTGTGSSRGFSGSGKPLSSFRQSGDTAREEEENEGVSVLFLHKLWELHKIAVESPPRGRDWGRQENMDQKQRGRLSSRLTALAMSASPEQVNRKLDMSPATTAPFSPSPPRNPRRSESPSTTSIGASGGSPRLQAPSGVAQSPTDDEVDSDRMDYNGFKRSVTCIIRRRYLSFVGKNETDPVTAEEENESLFFAAEQYFDEMIAASTITGDMKVILRPVDNGWSIQTNGIVMEVFQRILPLLQYAFSACCDLSGEYYGSAHSPRLLTLIEYRIFLKAYGFPKVTEDLSLAVFSAANMEDTRGLSKGQLHNELEFDEFLTSLLMLAFGLYTTSPEVDYSTIQSRCFAFATDFLSAFQHVHPTFGGREKCSLADLEDTLIYNKGELPCYTGCVEPLKFCLEGDQYLVIAGALFGEVKLKRHGRKRTSRQSARGSTALSLSGGTQSPMSGGGEGFVLADLTVEATEFGMDDGFDSIQWPTVVRKPKPLRKSVTARGREVFGPQEALITLNRDVRAKSLGEENYFAHSAQEMSDLQPLFVWIDDVAVPGFHCATDRIECDPSTGQLVDETKHKLEVVIAVANPREHYADLANQERLLGSETTGSSATTPTSTLLSPPAHFGQTKPLSMSSSEPQWMPLGLTMTKVRSARVGVSRSSSTPPDTERVPLLLELKATHSFLAPDGDSATLFNELFFAHCAEQRQKANNVKKATGSDESPPKLGIEPRDPSISSGSLPLDPVVGREQGPTISLTESTLPSRSWSLDDFLQFFQEYNDVLPASSELPAYFNWLWPEELHRQERDRELAESRRTAGSVTPRLGRSSAPSVSSASGGLGEGGATATTGTCTAGRRISKTVSDWTILFDIFAFDPKLLEKDSHGVNSGSATPSSEALGTSSALGGVTIPPFFEEVISTVVMNAYGNGRFHHWISKSPFDSELENPIPPQQEQNSNTAGRQMSTGAQLCSPLARFAPMAPMAPHQRWNYGPSQCSVEQKRISRSGLLLLLAHVLYGALPPTKLQNDDLHSLARSAIPTPRTGKAKQKKQKQKYREDGTVIEEDLGFKAVSPLDLTAFISRILRSKGKKQVLRGLQNYRHQSSVIVVPIRAPCPALQPPSDRVLAGEEDDELQHELSTAQQRMYLPSRAVKEHQHIPVPPAPQVDLADFKTDRAKRHRSQLLRAIREEAGVMALPAEPEPVRNPLVPSRSLLSVSELTATAESLLSSPQTSTCPQFDIVIPASTASPGIHFQQMPNSLSTARRSSGWDSLPPVSHEPQETRSRLLTNLRGEYIGRTLKLDRTTGLVPNNGDLPQNGQASGAGYDAMMSSSTALSPTGTGTWRGAGRMSSPRSPSSQRQQRQHSPQHRSVSARGSN